MGLFNLKKNIEDLESNITTTQSTLQTNIDNTRSDLETNITTTQSTLQSNIDTTRSDLETNITTTQSTLQTNIDNTRSDLSVIEDNFSAGKDFIKASSIPNDSITTDKIHSNTITQEKIHGGGITPTGTILPFASETPPAGWLLCDGSTISRANYPDLFAVCGETYGAGDGSTTFNIPDLADRIPVGKGSTKTSLGVKGGAMNMTPSGSVSSSAFGGVVTGRTLSQSQMPRHDHGGGSHSHTITGYNDNRVSSNANLNSYTIGTSATARTHGTSSSGTIISTQGSESPTHDHGFINPSVSSSFTGYSMSIEQPYTVINYIIKY